MSTDSTVFPAQSKKVATLDITSVNCESNMERRAVETLEVCITVAPNLKVIGSLKHLWERKNSFVFVAGDKDSSHCSGRQWCGERAIITNPWTTDIHLSNTEIKGAKEHTHLSVKVPIIFFVFYLLVHQLNIFNWLGSVK